MTNDLGDKKDNNLYYCDTCDYHTSHKTKYDNHLSTAKHFRLQLDYNQTNSSPPKRAKKDFKKDNEYYCDYCDYYTINKTKYERHILTPKHQKGQKGQEKDQILSTSNYSITNSNLIII